MKNLAGKLVVMLVGLAGGLLLLEAILRLAGFGTYETVPDPTIGYRYIPHAHYRWITEGGSTGRFNSEGWRDVEHPKAKPAHTTRILLLGDSFVAAFQVPLDSTFHRRLESALNQRARTGQRFEVIALGQNGNGTTTEYLTYKRWGVRYDPDLVAVLFVLNDPADDWRPSALQQEHPFFVEQGDSLGLDTSFRDTAAFLKGERLLWLKSRSVLWAQLRGALATLRARFSPPRQPTGATWDGYIPAWNFDARLPADSIPAFRLTEKILARFAREVASDHRRFIVFASGFAPQEDRALLATFGRDPFFDPEKTRRWLTAVGARHGFDVVPLSPAFRAASRELGAPLWFGKSPLYGHWNSAGHAVAASVMERYLARTLAGLDTTGLGVELGGRSP
ncbi:MAG: SGNH/GDSL hydrolase family protein [Candidatus Eisenbacteria bacterium]|nr:SGNH/GDSL hydrolase family protein [Candidatus Eisenbacteria bacterium]